MQPVVHRFTQIYGQLSAPFLDGLRGFPPSEAYGTSKAAIKNLFESLQVDLAPEGISLSVVCPGFVWQPLTERKDFPIPFRIETDGAARCIVDGIEARKPEIHFPRRFSQFFKFLTLFPSRRYIGLCARMVKQP